MFFPKKTCKWPTSIWKHAQHSPCQASTVHELWISRCKAVEPEIKLPTSVGSSKKAREFQKNISFCFIDYAKGFDCVDHNKLWKILQVMGIPDQLTWILRNLYAGQEATVRNGHGTKQTGFKLGKEYNKAVYCHSAYLTYMQSTSCEMPGWMKHKLWSSLPGEITITSEM